MRFSLEAVARFAGLRNYTYRDPGAHAPGFMPSCATRTLTRGLSLSISTAESAPAGIAALVPVGSTTELSHKRTEPRLSGRACGTYLHGLNAPGNNLPVAMFQR